MGTLKLRDQANAAWVALRGPRGLKGATGDKGDTGDVGPQGPPGTNGTSGDLVKIGSATLTVAGPDLTISGLDLTPYEKIIGECFSPLAQNHFSLRVNSDSGANYNWSMVGYQGSSTMYSSSSPADTRILFGPNSALNEDITGTFEFFPSCRKFRTQMERVHTANWFYWGRGRWVTNSPITLFNLRMAAGETMAIGSKMTLYGVKK